MKRFIIWLTFFFLNYVNATPFSIQFAIPEEKIVKTLPQKRKDFAFNIPGKKETYIYQKEEDYYRDYQRSYFAVTSKKAGWDCLRHYEILANGCIPYFLDLDNCPLQTMTFLPKELIKEAMNLKGVSYLKIDHRLFDTKKYYEILNKLWDYTQKFLTTRALGEYVLKKMNYKGEGTVLFLSEKQAPDYMRCLTLIGLKEVIGPKVIDVPKVEHIYKSYRRNTALLYGKGFTYTKIIEDIFVDRENIVKRIKKKEFDFIIYGSVHRGMPYYELIKKTYPQNKIFFICGEDEHECSFFNLPQLFLRENYAN